MRELLESNLLLIICVIILLQVQVCAFTKCNLDIQDSFSRRNFTHGNAQMPLTITEGVRISSQISAHVMRTLLMDALGYENIVMVTRSIPGELGYRELSEFNSHCLNTSLECIPSVMIVPEVWVAFDQRQITTEHAQTDFVDVGSLGITGSYGWYLPSAFVAQEWHQNQIPVDHWRALQIPSVVSKLLGAHRVPSVNVSCGGCVTHVFYPRSCDETRAKNPGECALLLAQKGPCTDQVEQQIFLYNLTVVVAEVTVSPSQISTSSPVLLATLGPDETSLSSNFTRVKFPQECFLVSNTSAPPDPSWNCPCPPVYELRKFVWKAIRTRHDDIHELMENIMIPEKHLEDIIRSSNHGNNQLTLAERVCNWMIKNKETWLPWIPLGTPAKQTLYIGGMFPSLLEPKAVWSSPGDEIGALMAIARVNSDTAVLREYRLELPIVPTQCRRELAFSAYIEYLNQAASRKVVGILGPACSKATIPIAEVSRNHNVVIMGYGADDVSLSSREKYPFYFRTVPSVDEFKFAYMALFNHFDWKYCVTLKETKYPTGTVASRTQYMTSYGVEVVSREMPSEGSLDAESYVKGVRSSGITVVILNTYPTATRSIMCEAFKQGLTPVKGYVWFLVGWLEQDWWDIEKTNRNQFTVAEDIPCDSAEMRHMVDQGYFSLSAMFYGGDDEKIAGGGTVSEWVEEYRRKVHEKGVTPSDYATLAHDAVWTYALALDKLLRNSSEALETIRSDQTSRIYRKLLEETDFMGASGHVHFRGGDRLSNIVIKQNFATRSTVIGQFISSSNVSALYGGFLELNASSITWAADGVPRDTLPDPILPYCAVQSLREALGVSCTAAVAIAAALAFASVGAVLAMVFWILKRRYSAKYRATKKRLKELGLLDTQAALDIFSLDAWEVSRDRVLLNRKLGQGAFGAVYGGEVLDTSNKDFTVPIAVKTLNAGANVGEKVEFLSEAYTMKHFEHENIVTLLGVCTEADPVYIIMELLIHGDLKSFLLSRRCLIIQQGTPEADDVTPAKLTRMALDIARGLEYLSRMKYVHRDLALRNCLVGLDNRVKIGDFGLARSLNESDYYRFETKGTLPIRWMAPEALADGLFTAQTDVWSYGIILWELATFGGFPYQGLSNLEVIERVKQGFIMEIPQRSSAAMASLLRSCWNLNPLSRPTPYTIVQLITEEPELVHACVDVPPTQVTDTSCACFYAPKHTTHARNNKLTRTPSISSQLSERISGILGWNSPKLAHRETRAFGSPMPPKKRHPETIKRKTSVFF